MTLNLHSDNVPKNKNETDFSAAVGLICVAEVEPEPERLVSCWLWQISARKINYDFCHENLTKSHRKSFFSIAEKRSYMHNLLQSECKLTTNIAMRTQESDRDEAQCLMWVWNIHGTLLEAVILFHLFNGRLFALGMNKYVYPLNIWVDFKDKMLFLAWNMRHKAHIWDVCINELSDAEWNVHYKMVYLLRCLLIYSCPIWFGLVGYTALVHGNMDKFPSTIVNVLPHESRINQWSWWVQSTFL